MFPSSAPSKCPPENHIISRNFNFEFPDENILQFLHGLDPVQSQSCLNINFGSQKSKSRFSFSQLPMIPDGQSQDKIRNYLKYNVFSCYIVSIGKKYTQVGIEQWTLRFSKHKNSQSVAEINPIYLKYHHMLFCQLL